MLSPGDIPVKDNHLLQVPFLNLADCECLSWLGLIMVKSRPQRAWRSHINRTGSRVIRRDDYCWCMVCRWDGVGLWDWIDECSVKRGDGKYFCPNFLQPWKYWQKELTEVGNLFKYFITLIISIICKIEETLMQFNNRHFNRYYIYLVGQTTVKAWNLYCQISILLLSCYLFK